MRNWGSAFKKDIELRINSGQLKVASSIGAQDAAVGQPRKPGKVGAGVSQIGGIQARKMNKTEAAYALYLEALKACGEIVWWEYESIKLRLADNTFYTPDFFLQRPDGSFEVHETKGFMRDDANVKIKVANDKFPWLFFVVRKIKGGTWSIKKVGNKG